MENQREALSDNQTDEIFSVILNKNNENKAKSSPYTAAIAVKPLVLFTSVFGLQMLKYSKQRVLETTFKRKVYTLFIVISIISTITFVSPMAWRYTRDDVPLNILTKTYGVSHTTEVIHCLLMTTFGNSFYYVELFSLFDNIDIHYETSLNVFQSRRILSYALAALPIVQAAVSFLIRGFEIRNFIAHFTFFTIMVQGTIIVFLTSIIYVKQITLNRLLITKTTGSIPNHKKHIFSETCLNITVKYILREPILVQLNNRTYSWLELMQIYNKIAHCVYIFNKMYAAQVFIMFSTWLLCTLLTICRYLSPTVKNSDLFLSDIFLYTSINGRPIFVTQMCEVLMAERKKTLAILLNHLLRGDLDNDYSAQVRTMIDLVETRKLEITGNVFAADAPTVMNFSGRAISYAVLMIQYFYIHVFQK